MYLRYGIKATNIKHISTSHRLSELMQGASIVRCAPQSGQPNQKRLISPRSHNAVSSCTLVHKVEVKSVLPSCAAFIQLRALSVKQRLDMTEKERS
jgi:hypothetical protein